MSDLTHALSDLRTSLELYSEENIKKLSDAEIVDLANSRIAELELENSLYNIALLNEITGHDFERWYVLATDKFHELAEGEELTEEVLLKLLKSVRN